MDYSSFNSAETQVECKTKLMGGINYIRMLITEMPTSKSLKYFKLFSRCGIKYIREFFIETSLKI